LASRHKGKDGKIHGKNKIRFIDMAEFIATRWAENYPTDLKVKEVRFYRVAHKVGKEHCMKREVWSRPILSSIPEDKRELLVLISLKKEADKKQKYTPRFNVNDRAKPLPKVKP
jgi:hypothetical protein